MNTKHTRMGSAAAVALLATTGAAADVAFYDFGAAFRVRTDVSQYNLGSEVYLNQNWDSPPLFTAVDFSAANGFTRDDGAGFVATVASHGDWTFNPSNPGLGNPVTGLSFSGGFSASAVTPGINTDEFANASVGMTLYLDLSTDMQWSFGADFTRNVQSAAGSSSFFTGWTFQILALDPFSPFAVEDHVNWVSEVGSVTETAALTGTLSTGKYAIIMNTGTGVEFRSSIPGVFESSFSIENGYLNFAPVPAPGAAGLLGLGLIGASRRRR